ncbi:MAG: hypothetical protein ACJ780_05610 [Solirubrobacteraceae bacterium]
MTFTAAFASRGVARLRPPRADLLFDVELRGGSGWALLPAALGFAWSDRPRVDTVELYVLADAGARGVGNDVVVISLRGADRGYAVRLPVDAELRLTGLPVAFWGETPPAISLALAACDEVRAHGQPLTELCARSLTSARLAVVDASPLARQTEVVESYGSSEAPLAVALDGLLPFTVEVAVDPLG